MVRNTSFRTLPSSEPALSRLFLRTFPTALYSRNSMRARAIWARRAVAALHKRINHNQHKRREKGPRRGHSRTFYPRAARSRSPFRPTSQVEHHPITLLRLAVKLICPDCVSAPMKAIHDRGPGIARPSTPSVPSASPTDQLTPRATLRLDFV